MGTLQNKQSEIAFFEKHAELQSEYNVFDAKTNRKIVSTLLKLSGLKSPGRVLDLGCGAGVFTDVLREQGFVPTGIDISPAMIRLASSLYPKCAFQVGDVEALPYENNSIDGILLSGLIHHFPDPSKCIQEVARVLKPGGVFMAFDPNRMNPFMYLYRDKSSPFYSPVGVTENERPVLSKEVRNAFQSAGLDAHTEYLAGLKYRYVASPLARSFLFLYNTFDTVFFSPPFLRPLRPFVLTFGTKK